MPGERAQLRPRNFGAQGIANNSELLVDVGNGRVFAALEAFCEIANPSGRFGLGQRPLKSHVRDLRAVDDADRQSG